MAEPTFGKPTPQPEGDLAAPRTLTAGAEGSLSAPNATAPQAAGDIAAPRTLTALAQPSIQPPETPPVE